MNLRTWNISETPVSELRDVRQPGERKRDKPRRNCSSATESGMKGDKRNISCKSF